MMNKVPFTNASGWIDDEWKDYITISDTYQHLVTVASINAGINAGRSPGRDLLPGRMNQFSVILILRGTLLLSLDYISYSVEANHLLIVMPAHIVRIDGSSGDMEGKILILDKMFLGECNVNLRSPSMAAYMQLRKNPRMVFGAEEAAHLVGCFGLLEEKIGLRSHTFHREVMQNAILGFLLELAHLMVLKSGSYARPVLSRKEEIMSQFLQLLVQDAASHRSVGFYADKLCISPPHLSMVMKTLTGKPANKWIEEAVVVEAKVLLRSPHATVQGVAEALHFSDQSAFGKFFKKYTGLSPRAYRRL
jgi:AraC-like DNA-binding protein